MIAEQHVSHTADRKLQDIEKKYPGFIHMKLMKGIKLSFRLQRCCRCLTAELRTSGSPASRTWVR